MLEYITHTHNHRIEFLQRERERERERGCYVGISILLLKIEIISKDNFVIKNLWLGIIFSISYGNVNFLVILDYYNVR